MLTKKNYYDTIVMMYKGNTATVKLSARTTITKTIPAVMAAIMTATSNPGQEFWHGTQRELPSERL